MGRHAQVGLLLGFNSKFLMGIPAPFNGSPPRLLHEYTLYETLLESVKLETDVLDETCALQFELVFFRAHSRLHEYDYAVFCYS